MNAPLRLASSAFVGLLLAAGPAAAQDQSFALTIKDHNPDAASPAPVKYWDLAAVVAARAERPFKGTANDAVAELVL